MNRKVAVPRLRASPIGNKERRERDKRAHIGPIKQ